MANQILLSVDKKRLGTAPGSSVDLGVTAQNLTTLLDQVAVRAEGVDPSWYQVIPPYLPVFAQGQATARIVFQPPPDPAVAVAGRYPLRVRAASQEYPGQEGEDGAELEVQLVGDYRIYLERAESRDRVESVFLVHVENGANAPLNLQFKGSDPADALWYKFDPFQLTAPAGSKATATLTLRAKDSSADERTLAFTLTSQGEFAPKDGATIAAPVHQVAGQYAQGAPARLAISVQPPQVEGADRGEYQVRVANPGAAPTTVQLSAEDGTDHLQFDFEHVQLTLPPQSETSVRLVVRTQAPPGAGRRERKEFRVAAQPVNRETAPVSTQAALIQVGQTVSAAPSRGWVWVVVAVAIFFLLVVAFALFAGFVSGVLR